MIAEKIDRHFNSDIQTDHSNSQTSETIAVKTDTLDIQTDHSNSQTSETIAKKKDRHFRQTDKHFRQILYTDRQTL